jgi:uncharacterized protein
LYKYSFMKDKLDKISRYNFWKENPELGFERSHYANWLKQFTGNRLIKVLVGQRRSGKSYILRQFIADLIAKGVPRKNTLYINTEYLAFDFLNTHKDLESLIETYKKEFNIKGKYYLFIDEIQEIDQWEKVVNAYAQDFTEDVELVITGSNSTLLSGELSSLLSGRYVELQVFPFNYNEFIDYHDLKKGRVSYLSYLTSGGLPELVNLPNQETSRYYLGALRDTVLLRDVIQRHQVKDTALLTDVFSYLANTISSLTSITNLVNYFHSKKRKTTYDTIANYITYIEQTYIIHKCERYDVRGKELVGGNAKYYLNDLSFKNFIYSGVNHGYGHLLENLVYITLRSKGYATYVGHLRNKEIDFIATKDEKTIYLQSAFTLESPETIQREKAALLAIKDNHEKWIVTLDEIPYKQEDGIKFIPAWELLDVL